ncbi:hypothetical protein F5B22DRAFT_619070 [Xylaria bambusicola]|uniref:uncharacterized protein n=1 Tax=Xylaria bambusicola TaxID=326684 RepID=UPI0020085ACC|nr:uncharacterized protein F5B22DRAFT_619070 [Xylaria bambusicola]KAI0508880.1 hypothetical protein F5B22DRAFT_619070 [Xylaria bambusicola]
MFGSGNKLAAPLTADELEEKLVEEFIGIQDHPTIEDYPTVPDFFAPELGEQMEGITAENPCTVDHVSDEMVIDGTCALVTESPDIVMSGEESKDESMDVDHQMDDIDPMDEREDTGNIFGLRPSTDVALTTAASKLADIDSHMDEDSTTFDMSELLSSLSSTPEALAAQTSSVEPLTLGPTAEQQIGGNNGSTQPLSEPPPDTPSTTFSDVFDLADLEAQLASDIASLVPDADALSTPAPATASTAAPPVSFTAPSTLISTVPAPENAVSTSPTASSAPSDARATLAPASIRNKMPPRPRAAIPPIPFISKQFPRLYYSSLVISSERVISKHLMILENPKAPDHIEAFSGKLEPQLTDLFRCRGTKSDGAEVRLAFPCLQHAEGTRVQDPSP